MKRFVLRTLLALTPVLVIVVSFVILDPFKILYDYDEYSPYYFAVSRSLISTKTFDKNYEKERFDSFIFGDSRVVGFQTDYWKKYLPQDASPFVFMSAGESLYGMWLKVKYVDEKGLKIKNAILLISDTILKWTTDSEMAVFAQYPALNKGSYASYYVKFLEVYTSDLNFLTVASYKLLGRTLPLVGGGVDKREIFLNPVTNDVWFTNPEKQILENPDYYYQEVGLRPNPRGESTYPVFIKSEQKKLLRRIKGVLDRHETDYHFIVIPDWDQKKLHPQDKRYLEMVFGSCRVHDFSGANAITEEMTNYYEWTHFRPHVGEMIMDSIYGDEATTVDTTR